MSFKYLFFILAFSSLFMTGRLIKNEQDIEVRRLENENTLQTQILIQEICDGRGGSFDGKKLECK